MAGKQAIEGAKRATILRVDPTRLVLVGRDERDDGAIDGAEHPLYQERAQGVADEALVRSIMRVGVIEPIIFRNNAGEPEVVAGRRRVIAAREANRRLDEAGQPAVLVPAIHRASDDKTAAEVVVAENEIRKDLDPLTRARQAQRWISRGYEVREIAPWFGVTSEALAINLGLLDLSDEVQAAVEEGTVRPTAALRLRDLPREEQHEVLESVRETGAVPTSTRIQDAVAVAKETRGKKPRKATKRPGIGDVRHAAGIPYEAIADQFPAKTLDAYEYAIVRAAMIWVARGDHSAFDELGLATLMGKVLGTPIPSDDDAPDADPAPADVPGTKRGTKRGGGVEASSPTARAALGL